MFKGIKLFWKEMFGSYKPEHNYMRGSRNISKTVKRTKQ